MRRLPPGSLDVVLIVALALGLRLYRIADFTTFQGDQGVDALVVRRLLVDHVPPVEGPATSAGGVHLGPLYYYLLAPPMALDWLDPLADAMFMALLGALAVGLTYWTARTWFGRLPAITAGGLFAISPAAIEASRSAWNPAPAPFFVSLALGGLAASERRGDARWLMAVGAALGCIIQLHYFNVGLVVVFLLAEMWLMARGRSARIWTLVGLGIGAVLLLPLVVHEVTSGYPNVQAAAQLARSTGTATQQDSLPRRIYAVLTPSLVAPLLTGGLELPGLAVTLIIVSGLISAVATLRRRFAGCVLGGALVAVLVLAAVYRGPIFEHYLIAYSPVVFAGLAAAVAFLPRSRPWAATAAVAALGLGLVSLAHLPFGEPDRQLQRTLVAAAQIAAAAGGKPFGIWLLAAGDSDGAYRFQLERLGVRPADPSEPLPRTLFVVCQPGPCQPADPRDVLGPDWSLAQIDWSSTVAGVEIVRLVGVE